MAVPMCEGRRHVFIVGRELCRCGEARALALDPRETRIAGLVASRTWPAIHVAFVMCEDGVVVLAECRQCGRRFEPAVSIDGRHWKRMGTPRREAKEAQRALADRLAQIVRANACGCRDWKGTKLLS